MRSLRAAKMSWLETAPQEARVGKPVSRKPAFQFLGRHLIASYLDCDRPALLNVAGLERAMLRAVRASGASLLGTIRHVFRGRGATVVMALSESHASIHTYPEHRACFVDLFTCGDRCRVENFDRVLRRYLRPQRANCKVLLRHARAASARLKSARKRR